MVCKKSTVSFIYTFYSKPTYRVSEENSNNAINSQTNSGVYFGNGDIILHLNGKDNKHVSSSGLLKIRE